MTIKLIIKRALKKMKITEIHLIIIVKNSKKLLAQIRIIVKMKFRK